MSKRFSQKVLFLHRRRLFLQRQRIDFSLQQLHLSRRRIRLSRLRIRFRGYGFVFHSYGQISLKGFRYFPWESKEIPWESKDFPRRKIASHGRDSIVARLCESIRTIVRKIFHYSATIESRPCVVLLIAVRNLSHSRETQFFAGVFT